MLYKTKQVQSSAERAEIWYYGKISMKTNTTAGFITGAGVLGIGLLLAWGVHQVGALDCVGRPYGYPGCPLKSQEAISEPPATCGNGILDSAEQCDFGTAKNGFSNCTKGCQLLYCGDTVVSRGAGEDCEPEYEETYAKNPDTGELEIERRYLQPACGSVCTVPICDATGTCTGGCKRKFMPACPSETSTQAPAVTNTATANSASSVSVIHTAAPVLPPRCGDGTTQAGEECDDANAVNTDSCTNSCRLAQCGDTIAQPWEQCDDGNQINDDGCSNTCKLASCGDGTSQTGEECDDGNQINDDVCSNACKKSRCGDAVFQYGEECDDGNGIDADACSNICKKPRCGDGLVQTGEQCDDGNQINDDACTVSCQTPRCGDGVLQEQEQCDDGNKSPADACSNTCTLPVCGNGAPEAGEECDDGNRIDGDACTNACGKPRCGDSVQQAGEECDDGNAVNDDACTNTCRIMRCGDGVLQSGEECDDGKDNSNTKADACRKSCKFAYCGDAAVDTGEECDGTEECSNKCKITHGAAGLASGSFFTGSTIAIIGGIGGLGILGVAIWLLSGKTGKFLKKSVKKGIASIDDIPLDEIEMPWHR